MAHYHHCQVCGIPVAHCSDESCKGDDHANSGDHYCSIHHVDPKHRVDQAPPPPRYAVLVKEKGE